MPKFVFVTGGVVSGLGKGITAASLGRLLKARGLKVAAQKLDPYINVDPGTMSPYQHGEVFVTDDGAETDLDLGHYERFIFATSAALMCCLSHPARILTVTGIFTASATARTMRPTSGGSFMRALPSPFPATLGTGQPMLMSMADGGTVAVQPT